MMGPNTSYGSDCRFNMNHLRLRRGFWFGIGLGLAVVCGSPLVSVAQEGRAPAPDIAKTEESFYADIFTQGIYEPAAGWLRLGDTAQKFLHGIPRAGDVNAADEVVDSAWFVNRNGKRRMSLEEITQGSGSGSGLDPSAAPWTILNAKAVGKSPGLIIKDSRGDVYFLKFDPVKYPAITTAAEVTSSRLFHAIGYHVPHYTLVDFPPEILQIDPHATFYSPDGFKRPLTKDVMGTFMERVTVSPTGTCRALASLRLAGIPKGPFAFAGRRRDDPEDTIPHQDRRSLRALRVFAAWLNHHDIRTGNTLDMLASEGDRSFLKHYLIDFGSTLGSDNTAPKQPYQGHTYLIDFRQILTSLVTLGFDRRPWEDAGGVVFPSVGYFESAGFDPGTWKPMLPNQAFDRMTEADAAWAAKIVMSFTDEQIRAAVEAGQLPSQEAEAFLTKTLIERRDTIGRFWLEH